jgi:phage major head subunit gpT-like protein
MGAQGLSSRAIIGAFFAAIEADLGNTWIPGISMEFDSNQESETYKWLGMAPAMREWIGGRQAKGLRENGITIWNKKFEGTLEVMGDEIRRDKTSQVMLRVGELATRANTHWASLLSTLIINAESAVCYDNQYFFDTDHTEGSSGSQSNDLSIDISALPCSVHGSTTLPSPQEMSMVIMQLIANILGFKDDQGEPMNENALNFLVMTPISLFNVATAAISSSTFGGGETNIVPASKFNIQVAANARLTWTEKIAVFRTDGQVKPFIRQNEIPVQISAIAEGSELEFKEDKHWYGVMASRNVGYGYWQQACLGTMT